MKLFDIEADNFMYYVVAKNMSLALEAFEREHGVKPGVVVNCVYKGDCIVDNTRIDEDEDIYIYINSEIDKVKKMIKEGY
jgi:hypothetical protein